MNFPKFRRVCGGLAILVAGVVSSSVALAQYCAVGATFFADNLVAGCTVGSCWSPAVFSGSSTITGSQYPAANYACASSTPLSGALEVTLNSYDGNGNRILTKDALNQTTSYGYDALNRVTKSVDASLGVTAYAYDPSGNLAQVADPNVNSTTYAMSGLNDTLTLTSPDTGISANTYDSAGNVATRTDARGATATFTYDSLNRVKTAVYSRPSTTTETHTFTYDTGVNGKGRLASVVDTAATTSWTYTQRGRVLAKTQVIGSITKAISFSYNAAGQLISMTTPSGQAIGYTYSNKRIAGITVNSQLLLGGVTTEPFGPTNAWNWSNGLHTFRDYDLDGRLISWEFRNGTSVLRNDLTFDLVGHVRTNSNPADSTLSQAYQYDVLDRLTQALTGVPVTHTQTFNYDPNGNRQIATVDSNASTLSYGASSNQLQRMIGTVPVNYLAGNGNLSYTYNNANRLTAVKTNGTTTVATYKVNALGQRIQKTVGSSTTTFVYDELGHLLGEYDSAGNLIEETVWLENLPVATLRPTGTGSPTPVAVYYVHADQLGTPRAVTKPSGNIFMWRWDNVGAFGDNSPNENPAGQGLFGYNLRFPGQYFDAESGTNYNGHRDYDPSVGRYISADPIGLLGGPNAYQYGNGQPATMIDPTGLQAIVCLPPFCFPFPIYVPPIYSVPGQGDDPFDPNPPRRKRGRQDPVWGLEPMNPGKDCDGNCNPCDYDEMWKADGDAHGSTSGEHYHWIKWNQRLSDCMCFPTRGDGDYPPQGLRLRP